MFKRLVKSREDSVAQFSAAGFPDRAAVEQAEIEVLKEFLPAMLEGVQLEAAVREAIQSSGAQSRKDMGAVMKALQARHGAAYRRQGRQPARPVHAFITPTAVPALPRKEPKMKQTRLLIHTLREVPRDADVISQQLMMRAGMIQKLAAGIYDYLPLAFRSIRKFEEIVREELAKDGCQELLMPTVQPAELWQESGRWSFYGKELLRFKDRKDADFCLGPTHEEVITDIVRRNVSSYKQLPMNLYQIQTKFRDEIRPRFGLMRGREFIMKDAYSFDVDDAAADRSYWAMYNAYTRIFARLGVKFRSVEADSGAIGGSFTHEFHVLAGSGEDAILSCDHCDYTSNVEKTEAPRIPPVDHGPAMALRPAHFKTPAIFAMAEQAAAFVDAEHDGMPLHQTSKVYWMDADLVVGKDADGHVTRRLAVAVILRGDHEMNPVKVKNALGAVDLQPMADAEDFTGAQSGFLGPVAKEGTRHWQLQRSDPGRGGLPGGQGAGRRQQPHLRRQRDRRPSLRLRPRARPAQRRGTSTCAWRAKATSARAAARATTRPSAASRWARCSSWAPSTPSR